MELVLERFIEKLRPPIGLDTLDGKTESIQQLAKEMDTVHRFLVGINANCLHLGTVVYCSELVGLGRNPGNVQPNPFSRNVLAVPFIVGLPAPFYDGLGLVLGQYPPDRHRG